MASDTKALQGYVNDMLAVETEIHGALRRQKNDGRIKSNAMAHQLVSRAEDMIDRHLASLRSCIERLGGSESLMKKAVGGVLGAAAGIYDKVRSDASVSRALRDDYTALSFATVCYEMLHTTALAMRQKDMAELALHHMKDIAPFIVDVTELLPQVVVDELSAQGNGTIDRSVAAEAARNTLQAWNSAAASNAAASE